MREQALKTAFQNGEYNKALELLYQKSMGKIKKMTKDLGGSNEDALDVFQEAVLVIVRKVKTKEFDFTYDVDAYLYTVSKRMMINKRKRDNRIEYKEAFEDHMVGRDVQQHEKTQQNHQSLMDIFSLLGEKCKTLLKSIFIEELNTEELLLKFEISSADVLKTNKSRCKKKLLDLMNKQPHLKQLLLP